MAALLIHFDQESGWISTVANVGVTYRFVGETLEEQQIAVQQLAAAMQQGEAALLNGAEEIFEFDSTQIGAQEVIGDLFVTTDQMMFEDAIIYGTVGEEMLIDDLEMAGEALARALFS